MVNLSVRIGALSLTYATASQAPSPRGGQTMVCAAPPAPRRSKRWLGFVTVGAVAFVAGVGVASPSAPSSQAPGTASLVAHR